MPVVRPCPGQCAWTGDAGQVLDMAGHWPVRGPGGSVSVSVGEGKHHQPGIHHQYPVWTLSSGARSDIISIPVPGMSPLKWLAKLTNCKFSATHHKVHLLQREVEHEAAPAHTDPGDYSRYRVCKLFALVLKSSNCGNVWFMWALFEQGTDRPAPLSLHESMLYLWVFYKVLMSDCPQS